MVSVVVVNHNGNAYIQKCVRSIFNSNTKNIEVIVVDNASIDDSVKVLAKKFSTEHKSGKLKIVELEKNFGPAYARNKGAAQAKGVFFCFLDNDTVVEKNWAEEAKKLFRKSEKIGIIQCKLLLADKKTIDYIGEYMSFNGFLVQKVKGGTKDDGSFDQIEPILAAKSAGMFIRAKAFEDAGGFDDDYFIYVEETDLGWRCWLMGYQNMFLPSSVVYHDSGTSSIILGSGKVKQLARFHGSKNYILTHFKNLELKSMIKILPIHIGLWLGLAIYSLLRKGSFNEFLWIMSGVWWNITHFGKNWRKRRLIQSKRVVSDKELFAIWMKRRPLSYFLGKAIHTHKVGNAQSF